MESSLLQFYKNSDISLLKQFLLTIPVFNEINYFLQSEKFDTFLKSIEIHQIQYSVPYELNHKCTYLFLCTGILISKKQKKLNYQKLSRLSRTIKFNNMLHQRQITNLQSQRESQKIKTVQINQIYNENLIFQRSYSPANQFFICNQQRKTAIVVINYEKVPETIMLEIKERHNQKFKFLGSTCIFKNVQKSLLQTNINAFKVLKVSFDQFLYKKSSLRPNCIFFLIGGQVQVGTFQAKDNIKCYITKSPAILGVQNNTYVKSITQNCHCYYIEKYIVVDILKKNMEGRFKNTESEEQLRNILKSYEKQKNLNILPQITPRTKIIEEKPARQQRSNTTPVQLESFELQNSSLFKPKTNLSQYVHSCVPQNKKFKIKQHFTNFLNDKYSQFAIKKIQFIQKKMENQNSVLYQMKSLVAKSPQMSQINSRLKIQRLKKIQRCKQNILLTKQQSLNSINLRKYEEFQNSKVLNKIRRKIQDNIDKKQKKNKHWKTYIPNTSAFNRLSDFSVGF